MAISIKIQNFIRKQLELKLLNVKPDVSIVNESRSETPNYIPYTVSIDDNLIFPLKLSGLSQYYTEKAKNEMRAIASSSTMTYNIFCGINRTFALAFKGDNYTKFIPEVKRHPLNLDKNNDRGKANIDAELHNEKKVIMIEAKLFEPYYTNLTSSLKNIGKYKNSEYYNFSVFSNYEIEGWIKLFKHFEEQIKNKKLTRFNAMQFIKHLLSIINNKDTFESNIEIELISLTWYASMSILDLGEFQHQIMSYDDETIAQTKKAINHIKMFLVEHGYKSVSVSSFDLENFIYSTNILEEFEEAIYLKRYLL